MAERAAPGGGRLGFALGLTAAFAVVCGAGLAHHELWLDEAQAWLIAGPAASPGEVLAGLRYEGHPPAWYLAIWALARLWPSPAAMQALSLVCSAAGVFLLAWRSPFTRLQATLFAFSYFPLFELGVVARGYGLGFACLATHAAMRCAGVRSSPLLALPLAAAAFTSVHGLMLACALAIALALDPPEAADARPRGPGPALAAGAIGLAAVAGAIALARPPADASFRVALGGGVDAVRAAWAVYAPFSGFVPLPDPTVPGMWGSSPVAGRPFWGQAAYAGGLGVLFAAGLALRAAPAAFVGWLAGSAVMMAFSYAMFSGSLRHHAHYFLLWLLCLWVARPAGPRAAAAGARLRGALAGRVPAGLRPVLAIALVAAAGAAAADALAPWSAPLLLAAAAVAALAVAGRWLPGLADAARAADGLRPGGRGLTALLAVHVAAAALLYGADWGRPFSAGDAIAAAILADPRRDRPVYVLDVTQTNHAGPLLAARLGRPVLYAGPREARPGTYLVWDARRPPYRGEPTPEARLADSMRVLAAMARALPPGAEAWLVSEVALAPPPPGLALTPVAVGPRALAGSEPHPLCVYLLRRVTKGP